jgi:hypothetical protein
MQLRLLVPVLAVVALVGRAHGSTELQNWFNDPFFQISAAVPNCPLPSGPFIDEENKRVQSHRRAEKGTACWLAKECERPNAYAYDHEIATAIRKTLATPNPFAETSLWLTVQGRVVYIEGCVSRESQIAELEAFVRAVPYVQQAIAIVRTDPKSRPPYTLRPNE